MSEHLTKPNIIGIIIVKEFEDRSLTWETNYDPEYLIDLLEELAEEIETQMYEQPTQH